MKSLSGNSPKPEERRPDMGDMPIANCHHDCEKCLLKKEGCQFKVNSLNCLIAIKRMNKLLEEEGVEKKESETGGVTEEEQAKSLGEFIKELPVESDEELNDEDTDRNIVTGEDEEDD